MSSRARSEPVPTLLLAFLAGVLTILSPCVLPLAPIVVAGGRASDPRGPSRLRPASL